MGFRSWRTEPYLIPQRYGEGFWDEYAAVPSVVHIVCEK